MPSSNPMFLKIVFAAVAVVVAMAVVKDGRLLARAGLFGGCSPVAVAGSENGTWQACRRGRLDDYPDLTNKSCVSFGVRHEREFWRCQDTIVSSQTPRA